MTADLDTTIANAAHALSVPPLDLAAIERGAHRRRAARRTAWTAGALAFAGITAAASLAFGRHQAALTVGDPIDGVATYPQTTRAHVPGPVDYPQDPPVGGPHAPMPQACGIYTAPIANTAAVHSLEHGAMWIAYGPQVSAHDVAILRELVDGQSHRILSPYPSLGADISLQAWGKQLVVESADDPRVQQFADRYTEGPDTPERGSACTGTDATVADPHDPEPSGPN